MDTWILCVNLRGARLFRWTTEGELKFEKEFRRPRILLADVNFPSDSDLPEVLGDPVLENAEEVIARRYVKHLSKRLEVDFRSRRFGSLVVCAEPRLLGLMVSSLPPEIKSALSGMVEQDLYDVNESDLASYIEALKTTPRLPGAA